jgi:hypothetical protein
LAWFFDFLFWGRTWGVSFPLFVSALIFVGLWQARRLRLKPARDSWMLAAISFLLALVSAWRAEPLTLFATRAFAFLFLALFAAGFLDGRWPSYTFQDFFTRLLSLLPVGLLTARDLPTQRERGKQSNVWGSAAPILRGLLLAIPFLVLLGALLASADTYFSSWLGGLLGFLDLDRAGEYVFRAVYIFILAFIVMAVLLYAFFCSQTSTKSKTLIPPFLGFAEVATVLVSVALLFVAFVVIQFRYFFGGLSNIVDNSAALTYAEYARRGFAELVVVAFITLVLFLVASAVTQRKANQQRWFSGLGIGLFLLVAVILASAFKRLLLYEEAYGFTRMRTFPHVFMIWLGLLLLALVVLEVRQRQRHFAVAILLAAAGFVFTLPILNVDAFIVRANLARPNAPSDLDFQNLANLSADALPALTQAYTATNGDLKLRVAAALECYSFNNPSEGLEWQAWSLARANQAKLLRSVTSGSAFPHFVTIDELLTPDQALQGLTLACNSFTVWD